VMAFIKRRTENAQEWDTAMFRLATSTAEFRSGTRLISYHSVDCWHISRSPQCTCVDAYMRHVFFSTYQKVLADSTLFQDARSRLVENTDGGVQKDSLYVLQFFLSLSKTSQRTNELSLFISMWAAFPLLLHCIDYFSAEMRTGLPTYFHTVPQMTTCTTPLGQSAPPLCRNYPNEERKKAGS